MKFLVVVTLAGIAALLPSTAEGAEPCGQTRYTTRCGIFGWGRCARYRTKYCNPINGGWTDWEWEDVGECSVLCGGGSKDQERSRTCTNPPPKYGGADCVGPNYENRTVACGEDPCAVNGGWTDWEWEDVGECSVLCGGGSKDQERSRTCTNPPPQYGGADCIGPDYENRTVVCGEDPCADRCPEKDGIAFLAHATNEMRFYQCSNGVAYLHKCPDGTVFNVTLSVCVHEPQPPEPVCPESGSGLVPHENDCTKFYNCAAGRKYEMACPGGTKFDPKLQVCVWGDCQ